MFYKVKKNIVKAPICVCMFETIPVFFEEAVISFDSGAIRFKFFIDHSIRHPLKGRTKFTITIYKVCVFHKTLKNASTACMNFPRILPLS